MDGSIPGVTLRAWKPAVAGIREVLHARFTDPRLSAAHPRHVDAVHRRRRRDPLRPRSSPTWRRAGDGVRAAAPRRPRRPPGHGQTASASACCTSRRACSARTLIGPAVDQPILPGRSLRRAVSDLHDALGSRDDALEAETRLAFVAERIRTGLGAQADRGSDEAPTGSSPTPFAASSTRTRFEPVTLAAAAGELGAQPTQLARAFTARLRDRAACVRPRTPARCRARSDPQGPGAGRCRGRARVRRSGAPDQAVQAVPRDDAGSLLDRPGSGRRRT